MAAQDRVTDTILLTSPSGTLHEAKWVGNDISVNKKVTVFEYPDINGASSQDLGISAQNYPLDIYFDGENHDISAQNFEVSLLESGPWRVIHPVNGEVTLQPLSFTFKVQPVKSQTATIVSGKWVRVTPRFSANAVPDSSSTVARTAQNLIPDTLDSSGAFPEPKTEEEIQSFKALMRGFISIISESVRSYYTMVSDLRQEISKRLYQLEEFIDGPFFAASTAIGLVNQIILLPATVDDLVKNKVRFYKRLGEQFRNLTTVSDENRTATVSQIRENDYVSQSVIAGSCLATTSGGVLSRAESFEIINDISSLYNDTIAYNDIFQEKYSAERSRFSYVNQISTYDSLRNLVFRTIGFVIDANYSSPVQKIVTITESTPALEFAIDNYPNLTPEDAFDFLISTNDLTGNDIVQLGIGKEIILYVDRG